MAEKITKIQIGADVRDIGLGAEAALDLGSSVMEQIAETAWSLALDGAKLEVKTGEGLVTVDSGVVLDMAWLIGTMRAHPESFVDPELFTGSLAPKMGTFAGQGLTYEESMFKVQLGTGLEFSDNAICVNLGSGLMLDTDGSGRIKLNVTPGQGIKINPADFAFALDTLVAGAMLTMKGNGTVVFGSGLEVAMGTCLKLGDKGVNVDVDAILDELDYIERKERLATMLQPYLTR